MADVSFFATNLTFKNLIKARSAVKSAPYWGNVAAEFAILERYIPTVSDRASKIGIVGIDLTIN